MKSLQRLTVRNLRCLVALAEDLSLVLGTNNSTLQPLVSPGSHFWPPQTHTCGKHIHTHRHKNKNLTHTHTKRLDLVLTAHVMNLCWGDGAVGKGTCCHIREPEEPEFNLRDSNGRREPFSTSCDFHTVACEHPTRTHTL